MEDYIGPGGWVKVHRKITTWRWASSSNHMALFMQILLRANYKATTWRKETILPGQLLTGSKQLSDWTGLSRMQVRRALKDMEESGEITSNSTNKYSIITVTNWESYQVSDQQATNKEPTSDQQVTTSKKANNTKKEKKDKNTIKHSPLAFLFPENLEIQKWLLSGNGKVQEQLLTDHSHHILAEEIKKAFLWQTVKAKRKSDLYLVNWMSNKKTNGYNPNQGQDRFSGHREVPSLSDEDISLLKAAGQI